MHCAMQQFPLIDIAWMRLSDLRGRLLLAVPGSNVNKTARTAMRRFGNPGLFRYRRALGSGADVNSGSNGYTMTTCASSTPSLSNKVGHDIQVARNNARKANADTGLSHRHPEAGRHGEGMTGSRR